MDTKHKTKVAAVGNEHVQLCARFPAPASEGLREIALREERSIAWVIRRAVDREIARELAA